MCKFRSIPHMKISYSSRRWVKLTIFNHIFWKFWNFTAFTFILRTWAAWTFFLKSLSLCSIEKWKPSVSGKTWVWIYDNRKPHNARKTSVNWLQAEAFVLGPWACVNSTKQKAPFWPTLYLQDKALAPSEFIFRITFGPQPSPGSAEGSETAGQFLDSVLSVICLWKANIPPNSAAMQ